MGAAPHQVHSVFLGAVVPHAETSSFSFLNLLFLSKFLPSRLIRSPISAIPGGSVGCRARGYWLQGCGEHPFPSHWSPTHPSTIGMPLRPPHSSGKGPDLWGRNLVEVGGVSATPSCSLAAPPPPRPQDSLDDFDSQTQSSDFSPAWAAPSSSLESYMRAQLLSHVRLFVTLWTVARHGPLSMGCFRQEYWSGLPILSPRDLPNPGIEPAALASPALQVDSFTTVPPGTPLEP